MKIKKILQASFGVLDFSWDGNVIDKNGGAVHFQRTNIIFGDNYSGKTTLSKMLASLENGKMPDKYEGATFTLVDNENNHISDKSIADAQLDLRVFNKDFIKKHLSHVIDEDGKVNAFTIFGDDNKLLENKIGAIKDKLGSKIDVTGIYKELKNNQDAKDGLSKKYSKLEKQRNKNLSKKASVIKKNKSMCDDTEYDIRDLNDDIDAVSDDSYERISESQASGYRNSLADEIKEVIQKTQALDLKLSAITESSECLVGKPITTSSRLNRLVDEQLLEIWVKSGRPMHDTRKTCGFCGQDLPKGLLVDIDAHFTKESRDLEEEIDKVIKIIIDEIERIGRLFGLIQNSDFYSAHKGDAREVLLAFRVEANHYSASLSAIQKQLVKRRDDILRPFDLVSIAFDGNDMRACYTNINILINKNNEYGSDLLKNKENAKKLLRLHEVKGYIDLKLYLDEKRIVDDAAEKVDFFQNKLTETIADVDSKETELSGLMAQFGDESDAVKLVNQYLNHHFGHSSLSFSVADADAGGYKFQINRDGLPAYNLSEGERNIIAICYFIANLRNKKFDDAKPIIWIDDPVSSLDSHNIFLVFSLIKSKIVDDKRHEQLFVSTHNLTFLSYLKKIDKDGSGYFLVYLDGKRSRIDIMPDYLKNNTTLYPNLFKNIHKCAKGDRSDIDVFYTFGNNSRKFLETFIGFLYPGHEFDDGLLLFLDNDEVAAFVISRIYNENSHSNSHRGLSHIEPDVPQIRKAAEHILYVMETKYKDTYDSLIRTIKINNSN